MPSRNSLLRARAWQAALALYLGAGPLAGMATGSLLIGAAISWPEDPLHALAFWGLLAAGMLLGCLPSSLAAIATGVRHGMIGMIPYLLIMSLAAWLPWLVLRGTLQAPLRTRLQRRRLAAPLLTALDRSPWLLLFGIRLAPVAVFSWTNALFSLSRLGALGYLSASLLGALPRATALVAAGAGATSLGQALSAGRSPIAGALALAGGVGCVLFLAGLAGNAIVTRLGVRRSGRTPARRLLGSTRPAKLLRRNDGRPPSTA